jgi:predicted kinase
MPPKVPIAYMLCGLTGSGKTAYARSLEARGLPRLSVDETVFARHGRYDVDYPHRQYRAYHDSARAELDKRLSELLQQGVSVVLDYGFWSRKDRDRYKRTIEDAGGTWKLLYFKADRDLLRKRLSARNEQTGPNALTVDAGMLDDFLSRFEPPEGEGEEIIEQAGWHAEP